MASSNATGLNDADKETPRRRPGPFGPARILLPEGQKIETIRDSEPTALALERLADTGFSQLPVLDARNQVVGVFSWQSFGKRMSEIYSLRLDLSTLAVGDTDLEKPRFVHPDTYIDTETDWQELDYVLVGTADHLLGVLTITDIYGRLNDFAEAFVLLFEIEHEIRDIFRAVYPSNELTHVLDELANRSGEPESLAADALQRLLAGDAPAATDPNVTRPVQKAIQLLRKASRPQRLDGLEDFTFAQYRVVIFNQDHWPRFEAVFNAPREILQADFAAINDLRNIVFHFRRAITSRDTDRLRRFRDKRRSDRELYGTRRALLGNHETEAALFTRRPR
jgi:CBS domain-containing protein